MSPVLIIHDKFSMLSYSAKVELLEENDKKISDDKLKFSFPKLLDMNSMVSRTCDLPTSDSVEASSSSVNIDSSAAQADDFEYNKNFYEINSKTQLPDYNINEFYLDKKKPFVNGNEVPVLKFTKGNNNSNIEQWLREHKGNRINANNSKSSLLDLLTAFLANSTPDNLNNKQNSSNEEHNDFFNKLLSENNFKRIFIPGFNGGIPKLFTNVTIENALRDLETKQRELDKKLSKYEKIQYNYKNHEYNKPIKKINVEEKISYENESLLNRLMLIKEFVESISLKRDNMTQPFKHEKQKMSNTMNNVHTNYDNDTAEKFSDIVNGYKKKLKDWFDSLMKEVAVRNYNNFTENNEMMKNLKRLFYNNTEEFNNKNLYSRFKNFEDDQSVLNSSNKKYLNTHNPNNVDKYLAHNTVQLSNNRKDREYPIELFQLFGRALPGVKSQIIATKTD